MVIMYCFILIVQLSFAQVLAYPQRNIDFDDSDSYEDDILGFLDESYEVDPNGFLSNTPNYKNEYESYITPRNRENYDYKYIPLINGKPIYIPDGSNQLPYPDIPKRTQYPIKQSGQIPGTTFKGTHQTYSATRPETLSQNVNLPPKTSNRVPSKGQYYENIPSFYDGYKSPIIEVKPKIENLGTNKNPNLNGELMKGSSGTVGNSFKPVYDLDESELAKVWIQNELPAASVDRTHEDEFLGNVGFKNKMRPSNEKPGAQNSESPNVVEVVKQMTDVDSDSPIVVGTSIKKQKTKITPVPSESLHTKDEISIGNDESPNVVEVLVQKDASIEDEDSPIVVETLVKTQNKVKPTRQKNKIKPVHPKPTNPTRPKPIYEYTYPEYYGKEKEYFDKTRLEGEDSPHVVEVLVKKDASNENEEESPIVVETLVKTQKTKTKPTQQKIKIKPSKLVHPKPTQLKPTYEYIYPEYYEKEKEYLDQTSLENEESPRVDVLVKDTIENESPIVVGTVIKSQKIKIKPVRPIKPVPPNPHKYNSKYGHLANKHDEFPNVVEILVKDPTADESLAEESLVMPVKSMHTQKPIEPIYPDATYEYNHKNDGREINLIGNESEQALDVGDESEQALDVGDESEQALDIEDESEQALDIEDENEQALDIEDESDQALDVGDESEQGLIGSGMELNERSNIDGFLPVNPHFSSLTSNIQNQERRKFNKCFTPKNETGNCMPIQMCSVPGVINSVEELLKNVCVIDEVFIGVCCPEFPVETVRVDWGQFQEQPNSGAFADEKVTESVKECGKIPNTSEDSIPWPWMAPLVAVSTDKIFCGGALISEQYVLTAAHCTTKIPRNQILVRLEPIDSQKQSKENFAVVEIKRHAQYNRRSMQNDIALLKLSRRVQLGDFRRFVCLPEKGEDDYVGETAILLGKRLNFGENKDLESLPVISKKECQNKLGILLDDSVICTVPRTEETTCNGDSGAPLVIGQEKRFKVVGLLTWNRNDCDGRFPSLFTRISNYRKWIDNHAI